MGRGVEMFTIQYMDYEEGSMMLPEKNPYISHDMNESERRACMYLLAYEVTGDWKYLESYLFWRDANEYGKEYAIENHMAVKESARWKY